MMLYKDGSALLTMVLLTSICMIFCLLCWQLTITSHDLVIKKQEQDQQYQTSNALLVWALDLCKNNFEMIHYYKENYKKNLSFELPGWVVQHKTYKGTVLFTSKNDTTIIIKITMRTPYPYIHSCSLIREFKEGVVDYKISDYVVGS